MKIYIPHTHNLGDLFNVMPVISGLAKSLGEMIQLVVSDKLMVVKGFREFMEYQTCIDTLRFRKEILGMNESSYFNIVYSQEEFRNLTERPNRPIETMRHEKFVRDHYPNITFEVDDEFKFRVYGDFWADEGTRHTINKYVIGDRWLNNQTDTRRASNIFKSTGLFDDESKFYFLDYNDDLMTNASIIANSKKPFLGTFTGSGMLADLLDRPNICAWDDSMVNWNSAPIEYSYWKHYYGDRVNLLLNINDVIGECP